MNIVNITFQAISSWISSSSSSWCAASTDIPDPLSLHVSLSFIASGRSSGLHPVSSHSCCMNVRAGRPAFDWPYAGVHRSTSLTISSLLLQIEQVLAATPHKAPTVLPPTTYHENYTSPGYKYRKLYLYHHQHHHHVTMRARISLTLSCHPSLSSIALGRFFRLDPVSAQSCWRLVLADRPTFTRPCGWVHKSTSFMSSIH